MSGNAALLQAICENPDDDGLRLVFADWEEEYGRPQRAEFIRVQIALASSAPDDACRGDLEAREVRLLTGHRKEWAGRLRDWVRDWEFRRGFVEAVTLDTGGFLRRADDLFSRTPLRGLHLLRLGDRAEELAACPYLARLTDLTIAGAREPAHQDPLPRLLASTHLKNLRSLAVSSHTANSGIAAILTAAPGMPQLEALEVRGTFWTEADLAAFVQSPLSAGLLRLRLEVGLGLPPNHYYQQREPNQMSLLLASVTARLDTLDLNNCYLGAINLRAFIQAERTAPLGTLRLRGNPFITPETPQLLAEFAGSRLLQGLHALELSGRYLDGRHAATLANSPCMVGLVDLCLANNRIGSDGIAALAASPHLVRLRRLDLARSINVPTGRTAQPVGDTGVESLVAGGGLPSLAALNLQRNGITV